MKSPKAASSRHATMLRVDKGLYEMLAKAANEEGRSVNQQVVHYIKQALANRKAS